jgi:hypothetical protein
MRIRLFDSSFGSFAINFLCGLLAVASLLNWGILFTVPHTCISVTIIVPHIGCWDSVAVVAQLTDHCSTDDYSHRAASFTVSPL